MKMFLVEFEATDRHGTYEDSFETFAGDAGEAIEIWREYFPNDAETCYSISSVEGIREVW